MNILPNVKRIESLLVVEEKQVLFKITVSEPGFCNALLKLLTQNPIFASNVAYYASVRLLVNETLTTF